METPSYIATNIGELYKSTPPHIIELINDNETRISVITLSNAYNIPENNRTALSNIILFILIEALQPANVIQALQELVEVSSEDAMKIATDLENGILKKANIPLFKKAEEEIKTLDFTGVASASELRQQILEKTKRDSGLLKSQTIPVGQSKNTPDKKLVILKPGSRTQLLEQLQILGTIPNDDEISVRLAHIQEQISLMKKEEEDTSLESKIALKSFMFGEKGKAVADAAVSKATYSVPPTKYNVDPYREIDIEDRMVLSTHGGA